MKQLLFALFLLFTTAVYSQTQSKTQEVRVRNKQTGKVVTLQMQLDDFYNRTPKVTAELSPALQEYFKNMQALTPAKAPEYKQSTEYKSAQDAMKLLDAIIAGPKKN
jgi:membrane-associated HD superfamily phosphohydrolase